MSVRKTLCRLDDIPEGGATAVDAELDDGVFSLILLRQGVNVFAYFNECPHTGGRLDWAPGRFLLEPGQIICAAHGACFYVESGRCFSGPARGNSLAPVAVEVVDGEVRLS
jgi:nitrite reductase/ring-hydroxylating ferredoxin subunit